MFKEDKTNRGFPIFWFNDDYNEVCSLQESSSVEPHIWLGIHNAPVRLMCQDAIKLGLNPPDTVGWCDYELPKEVNIFSRMHLNQEQARELANKLLEFANKGRLD